MIQTIDLLGFLTLGVLGGFGHCVGMCSPFVLFISRRYGPPEGAPLRVCRAALVHGGPRRDLRGPRRARRCARRCRPTRRALLGVQRAASIVAGSVLVLWALAALSISFRVSRRRRPLCPRRGNAEGTRPRASVRHGALPRSAPLRPAVFGRHRGRGARGAARRATALVLFGSVPRRRCSESPLPTNARAQPRVREPPLTGLPAGDGGVVPLDGDLG